MPMMAIRYVLFQVANARHGLGATVGTSPGTAIEVKSSNDGTYPPQYPACMRSSRSTCMAKRPFSMTPLIFSISRWLLDRFEYMPTIAARSTRDMVVATMSSMSVKPRCRRGLRVRAKRRIGGVRLITSVELPDTHDRGHGTTTEIRCARRAGGPVIKI